MSESTDLSTGGPTPEGRTPGAVDVGMGSDSRATSDMFGATFGGDTSGFGGLVRRQAGGLVLGGVCDHVALLLAVAHASRPFIWCVGVAESAASSAALAAASRLTPRGEVSIWWCSSMIALSSIWGRGGQPGR